MCFVLGWSHKFVIGFIECLLFFNFISACQIQPLGVASSDAFPNNHFSASSASGSNVASKGRLNGVGAWSPSTNTNPNDYLQINLKYEFFICAVAIQGKSNADHWTTKFKLLLSLNNVDWVTYQEDSIDKVTLIKLIANR